MDFGSTLRALIEDLDKTQKQVAEDLNIAPTTLGNYIRGLREPDYNTLVSIANYFNVSTDYLLGNTKSAYGLSNEEYNLLRMFDELPEREKFRLIEIAKILK